MLGMIWDLFLLFVVIWVCSAIVSLVVLRGRINEEVKRQCGKMRIEGASGDEIRFYLWGHLWKHALGYLKFGPFVILKENRKKICPKCFR